MTTETPSIAAQQSALREWITEQERQAEADGESLQVRYNRLYWQQVAAEANGTPQPVPPFALETIQPWIRSKPPVDPAERQARRKAATSDMFRRREAEDRFWALLERKGAIEALERLVAKALAEDELRR